MGWIRRLRQTVSARGLNAEIREELEHHLEMRRRERAQDDGRRFGDPERMLERTHDMDVFTWLETWLLDLRHAARMLRRAPGFTAVVVLSLAIGIGANAAIFSLINTVMLKTLPVPHPEQLFLLSQNNGRGPNTQFSYPLLQQFEQAGAGRVELGGASSVTGLRLGPDTPTAPIARVQLVSGAYFATLGLVPLRGRWIDAGDNRSPGASPVVVVSYNFWMREFGGAPSALGRTLALQGQNMTIVGVAPPGFTGLDPASPAEVWAPVMMQSALGAHFNNSSWDSDPKRPWPVQERVSWLTVVARLPQPSAVAAVVAALSPAATQSWRRMAPRYPAMVVELRPGGHGTSGLRQTYAAPLRILMAMVGLMLLIAVANVATLLLARMVSRRREVAVRMALGVSPARLVRQLLTEGLLLALLSGAAAVALALWTGHALLRLASTGKSLPFQPDLDWHVWAFLAAVSLISGIVLGALPAWAAQRTGPYAELKAAGATAAGGGRVPLGRWLVVAQMALSLLLVVAAGLFSRSLAAMFHMDMGFDRGHVLVLQLARPSGDMSNASLAALEQQMLRRLQAIPGVRAAGLDFNGIDDGSAETSGVSFAGRPEPRYQLQSREDSVTQQYFAAVGMHLLRGREFDASDGPNTTKVVIINQAFARQFYPGQNPVGLTFGYDANSTHDFHIIGVVADARIDDPATPAVPMFYHLLGQTDRTSMRAEVGTVGDPDAMAAVLRQAVATSAPPLRVRDSFSLSDRIGRLLHESWLVAELSGGFALLALALACLGLYGVMAYAVAARGTEFGLRMALGAGRSQVLGLVLREVALLLAGGLALGLPLALGAGRWLQPLLPGIQASDPLTLAAAATVMAAVPMLVALHPAWRAACADPALALRAE